MYRKITFFTIIIAAFMLNTTLSYAQIQVPEGYSDRYIRIAEMGVITDTVNVWGDVNSAGRYILPEDTKLPELVSFSFGYTPLRGRDSDIDWSKTTIELKVSRYNKDRKMVDVALFSYKYHEPEPVEMFEFDLHNNDIVTLQVRKRPTFGDYLGVIAPVVSVIATSILLIENLR